MDSDYMQHQDREDNELTRRLEAYADARLSPELSATIRMRARVMTAAHRQATLARADADRATAAAAIAAQAQADRTRRSTWRRPLTALLAAGLTLGVGVGSVAAAQAGGPLYGVRIWAEALTLPAEADARAQAELQRLEDRLAEAAAASAAGNTTAANAALEAYAAIVNAATEEAGNDVSAAATLDAGVRSNIAVLSVLVERFQTGHGQAGEAIERALERAIDRSDSALDKMHEQPNATSPAADPTKSPKPDNTNQADKTANPNKPTDDPDKTANPSKPTDDPTVEAASTPAPDRTPRGGPPSDRPGGEGGGGGGPQNSNGAD